MKEIDQLTEALYTMFSGNKPGEYLDACTLCCMSEADAQRLKRLPLREIPLDLLIEYQGAAKPAVLDLSELKYFAPRILEFVKDFQCPSFAPEVALDRFGYFKDSDWTKEERALLNAFAFTFFKNYIETEPSKDQDSLIEILLMFHKRNFKIKDLLRAWEKSDTSLSLIRFSQLVNSSDLNKQGRLRIKNAFADDAFKQQFYKWLDAKNTKAIFKQKIEKAIMQPDENFTESDLRELSWTYDSLSN